jgi:hypothetical protein
MHHAVCGARCVQVVAEDSLDGMYHFMATMHQRGLAAQQLPNARVLYSSATGAPALCT